jgi:hypothetical protein
MANERRDYVAAFVIGAVVGVGATLLLTPAPRKKRLMYRVEPAMKRLRKRGRRVRKTLTRGL